LYNILDGVTLPSTALFDIAGNQTYAAGPDSYYRVDLTYRRQDGLLTLYRVTAAVSWPEHGGAPPVALPANTFITEVVNLH
jgi:hypothetical protein